jgi:SnoaL-like polyketide cyclase
LVRRYVEEVYDQRRLEGADEIFAFDFTLHDPDLPGGARGPEGVKRVVETFVGGFPDLQVSLDDEFSSGEKVVTRWTSKGYPSRRADGHSTHRKPVGGDGGRHLAGGR